MAIKKRTARKATKQASKLKKQQGKTAKKAEKIKRKAMPKSGFQRRQAKKKARIAARSERRALKTGAIAERKAVKNLARKEKLANIKERRMIRKGAYDPTEPIQDEQLMQTGDPNAYTPVENLPEQLREEAAMNEGYTDEAPFMDSGYTDEVPFTDEGYTDEVPFTDEGYTDEYFESVESPAKNTKLLKKYRSAMVTGLKEQGIKPSKNYDILVKQFYENVVKKSGFEDADETMERQALENFVPAAISIGKGVVKGVAGYFKDLKTRKQTGVELSPTEQKIYGKFITAEKKTAPVIDDAKKEYTKSEVNKILLSPVLWVVVIGVIILLITKLTNK